MRQLLLLLLKVKFLFELIRHTYGPMGAILGDDMGLGKTVQIMALLAALFMKKGTICCTIVSCVGGEGIINRVQRRHNAIHEVQIYYRLPPPYLSFTVCVTHNHIQRYEELTARTHRIYSCLLLSIVSMLLILGLMLRIAVDKLFTAEASSSSSSTTTRETSRNTRRRNILYRTVPYTEDADTYPPPPPPPSQPAALLIRFSQPCHRHGARLEGLEGPQSKQGARQRRRQARPDRLPHASKGFVGEASQGLGTLREPQH